MTKSPDAAGNCKLVRGDYVIFGQAVYYFNGHLLEYVGDRRPGTEGIGQLISTTHK